jgi:citronellol/citronellal dehydrogenase
VTPTANTNALAGRTAIVTGSSRGIGRAIALELARLGANVVVAARTVHSQPPWATETIHDTVQEIEREGGRAIAFEVDVRDEERVQALFDAALDTFGSLDVLVNNAGAFRQKPCFSTTPREFKLVMDVNVSGAFTCIAAALPHLARSDHAHILNLAPPIRTEPYWAAGKLSHAVSKLGLSVMTLGLAEELRPARIDVNALWPKTVIATIGIERLGGDALLRMCRKPEAVARAAGRIVSRRGVTGRCLLDEDVLREDGMTNFDDFAVDPGSPLLANYFVDPSETLD